MIRSMKRRGMPKTIEEKRLPGLVCTLCMSPIRKEFYFLPPLSLPLSFSFLLPSSPVASFLPFSSCRSTVYFYFLSFILLRVVVVVTLTLALLRRSLTYRYSSFAAVLHFLLAAWMILLHLRLFHHPDILETWELFPRRSLSTYLSFPSVIYNVFPSPTFAPEQGPTQQIRTQWGPSNENQLR